MSKVILLSQYPLPYNKIGSWTTMYRNYLSTTHGIDIIICKAPEQPIQSVRYYFVKESLPLQIKMKLTKNNKLGYLKTLKKAIDENPGRLIIQIIDNTGLALEVIKMLDATGRRADFYLQYFYHGFTPFENTIIVEKVDEIVLLTERSHQAFKSKIGVMPATFSVLHNGIDTKKFFSVPIEQKRNLKMQLGFQGKKIFTWCSQDRPKKGLDFILQVWSRVYAEEHNMVLLVIGATREIPQKGVSFLGRIPNDELPRYYQATDCYLFPTLWDEPFGLSLIEAMHSGAFCIASALGGVPEVLQYGKFGKLVQNPTDPEEWEQAINDFLAAKYPIPEIPESVYTLDQWNKGMNTIIDNAKTALTQR